MRFLIPLLLVAASLDAQNWSWSAPAPPLEYTMFFDYGWDSTSNRAQSTGTELGLPLPMSAFPSGMPNRTMQFVQAPPMPTAPVPQSSKPPSYFEKAPQLWTANGGTIYPPTNRVSVGSSAIPNSAQFYSYGYSSDYSGVQHFEDYAQGSGDAAGLVVWLRSAGYTGPFSACSQFRNDVVNTGGTTQAIKGGNASYGLDSLSYTDNGGVRKIGAVVAVQGYSTGDQTVHNGVSGIAFATRPNSTNVGVAGSAIKSQYASGIQSVGLMGEVGNTAESVTPSLVEDSVLLLDNWTTGVPLIVARKNNGTKVFSVDGDGRIVAKELILRGSGGKALRLWVDDSTGTPVLKQTVLP